MTDFNKLLELGFPITSAARTEKLFSNQYDFEQSVKDEIKYNNTAILLDGSRVELSSIPGSKVGEDGYVDLENSDFWSLNAGYITASSEKNNSKYQSKVLSNPKAKGAYEKIMTYNQEGLLKEIIKDSETTDKQDGVWSDLLSDITSGRSREKQVGDKVTTEDGKQVRLDANAAQVSKRFAVVRDPETDQLVLKQFLDVPSETKKLEALGAYIVGAHGLKEYDESLFSTFAKGASEFLKIPKYINYIPNFFSNILYNDKSEENYRQEFIQREDESSWSSTQSRTEDVSGMWGPHGISRLAGSSFASLGQYKAIGSLIVKPAMSVVGKGLTSALSNSKYYGNVMSSIANGEKPIGLAAKAIAGASVGKATQWGTGVIMSYGEGYSSALSAGLDPRDASLVGASVGILNTMIEQGFGKNVVQNMMFKDKSTMKLAKKIVETTGGDMSKLNDPIISKSIINSAMSMASDFVGKSKLVEAALEEGTEEFIQTYAQKAIESTYNAITSDDANKFDSNLMSKDTLEEALYAAVGGAIGGSSMVGLSAVSNRIAGKKKRMDETDFDQLSPYMVRGDFKTIKDAVNIAAGRGAITADKQKEILEQVDTHEAVYNENKGLFNRQVAKFDNADDKVLASKAILGLRAKQKDLIDYASNDDSDPKEVSSMLNRVLDDTLNPTALNENNEKSVVLIDTYDVFMNDLENSSSQQLKDAAKSIRGSRETISNSFNANDNVIKKISKKYKVSDDNANILLNNILNRAAVLSHRNELAKNDLSEIKNSIALDMNSDKIGPIGTLLFNSLFGETVLDNGEVVLSKANQAISDFVESTSSISIDDTISDDDKDSAIKDLHKSLIQNIENSTIDAVDTHTASMQGSAIEVVEQDNINSALRSLYGGLRSYIDKYTEVHMASKELSRFSSSNDIGKIYENAIKSNIIDQLISTNKLSLNNAIESGASLDEKTNDNIVPETIPVPEFTDTENVPDPVSEDSSDGEYEPSGNYQYIQTRHNDNVPVDSIDGNPAGRKKLTRLIDKLKSSKDSKSKSDILSDIDKMIGNGTVYTKEDASLINSYAKELGLSTYGVGKLTRKQSAAKNRLDKSAITENDLQEIQAELDREANASLSAANDVADTNAQTQEDSEVPTVKSELSTDGIPNPFDGISPNIPVIENKSRSIESTSSFTQLEIEFPELDNTTVPDPVIDDESYGDIPTPDEFPNIPISSDESFSGVPAPEEFGFGDATDPYAGYDTSTSEKTLNTQSDRSYSEAESILLGSVNDVNAKNNSSHVAKDKAVKLMITEMALRLEDETAKQLYLYIQSNDFNKSDINGSILISVNKKIGKKGYEFVDLASDIYNYIKSNKAKWYATDGGAIINDIIYDKTKFTKDELLLILYSFGNVSFDIGVNGKFKKRLVTTPTATSGLPKSQRNISGSNLIKFLNSNNNKLIEVVDGIVVDGTKSRATIINHMLDNDITSIDIDGNSFNRTLGYYNNSNSNDTRAYSSLMDENMLKLYNFDVQYDENGTPVSISDKATGQEIEVLISDGTSMFPENSTGHIYAMLPVVDNGILKTIPHRLYQSRIGNDLSEFIFDIINSRLNSKSNNISIDGSKYEVYVDGINSGIVSLNEAMQTIVSIGSTSKDGSMSYSIGSDGMFNIKFYINNNPIILNRSTANEVIDQESGETTMTLFKRVFLNNKTINFKKNSFNQSIEVVKKNSESSRSTIFSYDKELSPIANALSNNAISTQIQQVYRSTNPIDGSEHTAPATSIYKNRVLLFDSSTIGKPVSNIPSSSKAKKNGDVKIASNPSAKNDNKKIVASKTVDEKKPKIDLKNETFNDIDSFESWDQPYAPMDAPASSTSSSSKSDTRKEVAKYSEMLGDVVGGDVKMVNGIINVLSDSGAPSLAYAIMTLDGVTLSDVNKEGAIYHEAFHRVSLLVLSNAERAKMYMEARNKYGLKGKSDKDVEENVAELFRAYMLKKSDTQSFISKMLYKISEYIKSFFGLQSLDYKDLNSLFDDIAYGKFRNVRTLNSESVARFKSTYRNETAMLEMSGIRMDNITSDILFGFIDGLAYDAVISNDLLNPTVYNSVNKNEIRFDSSKIKLVNEIEKKIKPQISMLESIISKGKLTENDVKLLPVSPNFKVGELSDAAISAINNRLKLLKVRQGSFEDILDNFDSIISPMILSKLKNNGFNSRGILSTSEESDLKNNSDISSVTNDSITSSYEINPLHNTADEVKILFSVLRTGDKSNMYSGFPELENMTIIYNKIMTTLNIDSSIDVMMAHIQDLHDIEILNRQKRGVTNPMHLAVTPYSDLLNLLSDVKYPDGATEEDIESIDLINKNRSLLRTKFQVSIQKHKHSFQDARAGEKSFSITDANTTSKVREISKSMAKELYTSDVFSGKNRKITLSNFVSSFRGGVIGKTKTSGIVSDVQKAVRSKSFETSDAIHVVERIVKGMSYIGVDVNKDILDKMIDNIYYSKFKKHGSYTDQVAYFVTIKYGLLDNFVTTIANISSEQETSSEYSIRGGKRINIEYGLSSSQFIKAYANAFVELYPTIEESSVYGPGGNKSYIFSEYNALTRFFAKDLYDAEYVSKLSNVLYNASSSWLSDLKSKKNSDSVPRIHTMSAFKIAGVDSNGKKYKSLTRAESLALKLNSVLNGYFPIPQLADKSTHYFVEGFDTYKDMFEKSSDGKSIVFSGLKAARQYYRYAESEYKVIMAAYGDLYEFVKKLKDSKGNSILSDYEMSFDSSNPLNIKEYIDAINKGIEYFDSLDSFKQNKYDWSNLYQNYHFSNKAFDKKHNQSKISLSRANGVNFRYFEGIVPSEYKTKDEKLEYLRDAFGGNPTEILSSINQYIFDNIIVDIKSAIDDGIIKLTKGESFDTLFNVSGTSITIKSPRKVLNKLIDAESINGIAREMSIIVDTETISESNQDHALCLLEAIARYSVNSGVSTMELEKLIHMDLAFYKDVEDRVKRLSALASTGTLTRNESDVNEYLGNVYNKKQYNSIRFKENYSSNKDLHDSFVDQYKNYYYYNYVKFSKDSDGVKYKKYARLNGESDEDLEKRLLLYSEDTALNQLKGFLNIDVTDGQAFISPEMHRQLSIKLGDHWAVDTERYYQLLKLKDSGNITDVQLDEMNSLKGIIMQPLKMVYVGNKFSGSLGVPMYDKMSLATLFPSYTKGSFNNKLTELFEGDRIGMVMFESTAKSGYSQSVSFYDKTGLSVNSELDKKNSKGKVDPLSKYIEKKDFSRLIKQLETRHDPHEEIAIGTQASKIIPNSIDIDGTYTVNGVEYTGDRLIDAYAKILSAITDIGSKRLLSSFNINRFKSRSDLNRIVLPTSKNGFASYKQDAANYADSYIGFDENVINKLSNDNVKINDEIDNKLNSVAFVDVPSDGSMNSDILELISKAFDKSTPIILPSKKIVTSDGNSMGYGKIYESLGEPSFTTDDGSMVYMNKPGVIFPKSTTIMRLNKSDISKFIADELSKSGVDQYVVNSIISGSINPSVLPNTKMIESKILSKVKNNVIDIDVSGDYFVQMSSFGMSKKNTTVMSNSEYLKQDYAVNRKLKLRDSNNRIQIAVSTSLFKHIIPNYDNLTHDERVNILKNSSDLSIVTYRIPTQAPASCAVVDPVEFLDDSYGNVIVLPDEITSLNGSDFDIDKLYAIRYNYNYNKESNRLEKIQSVTIDGNISDYGNDERAYKGLVNSLVDIFISTITSNSNVTLFTKPLDTDTDVLKRHISDIAKEIGITSKKKSSYYLTGKYQIDVASQNIGAGMLIGAAALNTVHEFITKYSNVKLNNSYVVPSIASFIESVGSENKSLRVSDIISKSNPFEKLNIKEMSNVFDMNGDMRSYDWHSAIVSALVDAVKDPYILLGNYNEFTQPVCELLIRCGFGSNFLYLVNQPIIRELSELALSRPKGSLGISNYESNRYVYEKELAKKYLDELESIKSSIDKNYEFDFNMLLNQESLFNMIKYNHASSGMSEASDNKKRARYLMNQLNILASYKTFEAYASELTNIVLTSNVDTAKYGKSFAENILFSYKFENFRNNGSKYFTNVDNMFNDTYISNMYDNSIVLKDQIFGRSLIQCTDGYKSIMNSISNHVKLTKESINSIDSSILNHITSKFFDKFIKDMGYTVGLSNKYKSLFFGKDSIVEKVRKLQYMIDTGQEKRVGIVNNKLIKFLKPNPFATASSNTPMTFITSMHKVKSEDERSSLTIAWKELFEYTDDQEITEIANLLIAYAYFNYGNTYSGKDNILSIAPIDVYAKLKANFDGQVLSYNDYMDNVTADMADDYIDNIDLNDIINSSWKSNDIFPQIGSIVQDSKYSDSQFFSTDISKDKLFENIDYNGRHVSANGNIVDNYNILIPTKKGVGRLKNIDRFKILYRNNFDPNNIFEEYRIYTKAFDIVSVNKNEKREHTPVYVQVRTKGYYRSGISVVQGANNDSLNSKFYTTESKSKIIKSIDVFSKNGIFGESIKDGMKNGVYSITDYYGVSDIDLNSYNLEDITGHISDIAKSSTSSNVLYDIIQNNSLDATDHVSEEAMKICKN